MKKFLNFYLIFVLLSSILLCQSNNCMELESKIRLHFGNVNALQIANNGNYVYVLAMNGLYKFQINETKISFVGSNLERSYTSARLAISSDGRYAYIGDDSLFIYDITSNDPKLKVRTLLHEGRIKDLKINDTILIVGSPDVPRATNLPASWPGGINIYNIKSPENPVFISYGNNTLNDKFTGYYRINYQNNYVFGFYYEGGNPRLFIWDISNINAPQCIGITSDNSTNSKPVEIITKEKWLFLLQEDGDLTVCNIQDKRNPVWGKYSTTRGIPKSMVIFDNTIFAVHMDGIDAFDISNPSNFTRLSDLKYNAGSVGYSAIALNGNNIIVGQPNIINTFNTNLVKVDSFEVFKGTALKVLVNGDYAYILDDEGGIKVIDISDSANPILFSPSNLSASAICYYIFNNKIFIGEKNYAISIYDLNSNAINPTKIATINLNFPEVSTGGSPSVAYSIVVKDNILYVWLRTPCCETIFQNGKQGIATFNITNINQPQFISLYSTPGVLKTNGDRPYGLPTLPSLLSINSNNIVFSPECNYFFDPLQGDGAYGTKHCEIINSSNGILSKISSLTTQLDTNRPYMILAKDNTLFILTQSISSTGYIIPGNNGFYCFDVSNPQTPERKYFYSLNSMPYDGIIIGDTLTIASGDSVFKFNIHDLNQAQLICKFKSFDFAYSIANYKDKLVVADRNFFTILKPNEFQDSSIHITSPSGGELWQLGTTQNIYWTSSNVREIKIEYSTNNGASWFTEKDSIPADNGIYPWLIPSKPSNQCKIKISAVENHNIKDISNIFTIVKNYGIPEDPCSKDDLIKQYLQNGDNDHQNQMGVCPTSVIVGNGQMTVGFNKNGKIVSLFYPSPGYYDHIPYQTEPSTSDSMDFHFLDNYGAPHWLGSFAGIQIDDYYSWLSNGEYQMNEDYNWIVTQEYEYDSNNNPSPILIIKYYHKIYPWKVIEKAFVPPGGSVLVRNFKFIGTSNKYNQPITNLKFYYYTNINPNGSNQLPNIKNPDVPKNSKLYSYTIFSDFFTGWKFIYNSTKMWPNKNDYIPNISVIGGDNFNSNKTFSFNISSSNKIENIKVSNITASDKWLINSDNKIYDDTIKNIDFTENGGMWFPLPSQETSGIIETNFSSNNDVTIYITAGFNENGSKTVLQNAFSDGFDKLYQETTNYWTDPTKQLYLNKINNLQFSQQKINILPDSLKMIMKLWAMTMSLMYDINGGIIASPNLIPLYYPMWPRDAMWQMLAWELIGDKQKIKSTISKLFSSNFIDTMNITNGNPNSNHLSSYWRQNYSLDGNYTGLPDQIYGIPFMNYIQPKNQDFKGLVEFDQMSLLLWFIWNLYENHYVNHKSDYGNNVDNFLWDYCGIIQTDIIRLSDFILNNIIIDKSHKKNELDRDFLMTSSWDNPEWGTFYKNLSADLNGENRFFSSWQNTYCNSLSVGGLYSAFKITGDSVYFRNALKLKKGIVDNLIGFDKNNNSILKWGLVQEFDRNDGKQQLNGLISNDKFSNTSFIFPVNIFDLNNEEYAINYYQKSYDYLFNTQDTLFIGDMYYTILNELNKQDTLGKFKIGNIVNYIRKRDAYNNIGYIPERLPANITANDCGCFRKGASPLGWGQAIGLLLGFYSSDNFTIPITPIDVSELEVTNVFNVIRDVSEEIQTTKSNLLQDSTYKILYDFATVNSPIYLLAINKIDTLKFGIESNKEVFKDFSGILVFDTLNKPMAIFNPQDTKYSYQIYAYNSGPFILDIWKSFFDCYLQLHFEDTLKAGTTGTMTLDIYSLNQSNFKFITSDPNKFEIRPKYIKLCNQIVSDIGDNTEKSNSIINILPNPSNDYINIIYNQGKPYPVSISIINNLGLKIKNIIFDDLTHKGEQKITIDLDGIPSGVYYCNLDYGKESITVKFIVIK
ncbi:MAG: T9SS type A sorting domain-containing protein [Bacteroidetes bacterium]|nr:MAG: T9SS type A sorting domain-containing protein [Bacteroidota bacterium]